MKGRSKMEMQGSKTVVWKEILLPMPFIAAWALLVLFVKYNPESVWKIPAIPGAFFSLGLAIGMYINRKEALGIALFVALFLVTLIGMWHYL
jgi:hypothetical protein